MEPKVTRGNEVARVPVGENCWRKTLGWGERTLISEVALEKGGIVPLHSHPHEQIGYVARGAVEFTIGEEKVVIRTGDGYVIPGGVVHGCYALEESLALDIFSPVRDEYK